MRRVNEARSEYHHNSRVNRQRPKNLNLEPKIQIRITFRSLSISAIAKNWKHLRTIEDNTQDLSDGNAGMLINECLSLPRKGLYYLTVIWWRQLILNISNKNVWKIRSIKKITSDSQTKYATQVSAEWASEFRSRWDRWKCDVLHLGESQTDSRMVHMEHAQGREDLYITCSSPFGRCALRGSNDIAVD